MARCRDCGRFAWFRKICHACAHRERRYREAGFERVEGTRRWEQTRIIRSSEVRRSIEINGVRYDLPGDGPVSDDLVQSLGARLDLPLSEVRELLARVDAETSRASTPVRRVDCAGCGRTVVDRTGWCVYCGAELRTVATEEVPSSTREESDRRVLEEDVHADEETPLEERSFLRRLKGL